MSVDYAAIGKRIKEIRKLKRVTQEQLSEKINVTVGYVSQCERGISHMNLEKLSEVADVLECDLSFLVSGTSTKSPEYLNTELLEKFQKLNTREKKLLIGFIDVMLENI